ncbi:hypothetical protein [Rhizobium sp. BK661]|uniref:hypothetical protein n=1 Tax=unclassified Rhizobium TaxID=2613769 RepID=UPI002169B3E6|nr:hypothetical protein [Rhizobium sp. BK661]
MFLLLRLSPDDPTVVIAGDNADATTIQRIRASLGLDRLSRRNLPDFTAVLAGPREATLCRNRIRRAGGKWLLRGRRC